MKQLAILLFITLFFCPYLFSQTHGTSPNWSSPTEIPKTNTAANATKGGLGHNILRLSDGTLLQTYQEQYPELNGQYKLYIVKSTDDGATWGSPINYLPTTKTAIPLNPTFAKDKEDNIHFIWQRRVPSRDVYYSKMDKNLNVLIDTVRISQQLYHNQIEDLFISVDQKDRIHVIWHDGNPDSTSSNTYFTKIQYVQSPDGGLTWHNQISLSDTTIHKHAAFPRMSFDAVKGDTLAIPWRQQNVGNNWDVWMAYSTDGGVTWKQKTVANTGDAEWDPMIVMDENNRIHLTYHEYKQVNLFMSTIEYAYSDDLGNTWDTPNHRTLSRSGIKSELTFYDYNDRQDLHCLCWKDDADFSTAPKSSDVMCSYSTDQGKTWIGQEFVTDLGSTETEFKSVEVGSNGTCYVSFEYLDASGYKVIYFSKRNPIAVATEEHYIQNFTLYPNPTSQTITIETPFQFMTYKIYSILGQELLKATTSNHTINIKSLPNGMYLLQLQLDGKEQLTKKFIKN